MAAGYTLAAMPRTRFAVALTVLGSILALSLSACAPAPPERTEYEEHLRAPEEAPQFYPDGSASENLPYFTEVLRQFSVGTAEVRGAPIVDALAAAGFDKASMQVSFDESKTNLVADSIYASVRIGDQCLIGQVVVEDRSFVAEHAAAVGPNKDICLIGQTRPIDW